MTMTSGRRSELSMQISLTIAEYGSITPLVTSIIRRPIWEPAISHNSRECHSCPFKSRQTTFSQRYSSSVFKFVDVYSSLMNAITGIADDDAQYEDANIASDNPALPAVSRQKA